MNPQIHAKTNLVAAAAASAGLAALLAACGGGGDTTPADDSGSELPTTALSANAGWRFGASLEEVRSTTLLDKKAWRFIQDDQLTDAAALSGDTTAWSSVKLPHSWNEKDASRTDQTTPTSVNYKRGLGWYRLEFDAPTSGATHWLQFDAASIVADVWLNGEKLGQHKGAFTAFRFDLKGKLKRGQKNVLLVKTDNSAPVSDTSPTAIAPLLGDFNMSGGLYRSVSLVSTPSPVHFALDDFGSSGVFARTTELNAGRAKVDVRVKLKNGSRADRSFIVQATLLEADGKTVKSATQRRIELKAGAPADAVQDMTVPQPHLWQGLADPYLYKLVVEIKDARGATLDKVVQDFGIRMMSFDADKGFILNGKSVPLRGVNMHQDFFGKAWVIGHEETDLSMAIIKEIGANTLRLPHYPHAQYTVQQADKAGLVVMAELPFVIGSSLILRSPSGAVSCMADPETTGFSANARQQLQELIRQQYNHASIGLWSIANEATTFGSFCGQTDANNNVQPLLRSLQSLAKSEDPGRFTTLAQEIGISNGVIVPSPVPVTNITDTFSVNRYFLWYYGTEPAEFGQHLDELHAQIPTQPLGIGEYGAGAALSHHTDNPLGGRPCSRDTTGSARICYQPEEYASYVHEQDYATIQARPYLYGSFVWNMFDFGSGIRHEGDIGATNTKGLVTFDRSTRKDSFFFYKAHWRAEPLTHLAGRRYTQRAYPVADVKVYSNGDSVTLQVNGAPVGTLGRAQCPNRVCEFKGVSLKAGANSVVAEGAHGGRTVRDGATWNLDTDNATNLFIAAGQLASGFVSNDALLGGHRYGSDNFFTGGTPVTLAPTTVIRGLGSTTVPETGRVWDAYREGSSFSYDVPLADGNYTVTLGILEPTATAAGARVLSVDANGVNVVSGLDPFAKAGGRNTATTVSFPTTVTAGKLKLDFKGIVGKAIVSNIAVVRQ
jgi:beta-galactosidase